MNWSVLCGAARIVSRALGAVSRLASVVMLALAGLGPPKPRFLRHEDAVAQIADDSARSEKE